MISAVSMLQSLLTACALLATALAAAVSFNKDPFREALSKRQAPAVSTSSLTVDLGYEIYHGVANSSTGLNDFLGYSQTLLRITYQRLLLMFVAFAMLHLPLAP